EERMFSRNFTGFGLDMNVFVSLASAILVLCFIVFTIIWPDTAASFFGGINNFINEHFSWLYVFTINAAFFFLIVIGLSKLGRIRLGGYTARPEYSNAAWYAMMFSAGIGIGIFFYGVAEPILHQDIPEGLKSGSVLDNFKVMYMHWGGHAWAAYGLVAIGLGYFAYNKKLPFAPRSLFYPLIKEKIYGILGDIIDTVAVLSVLFGLATSLGLGAQQINSGLSYLTGLPFDPIVQIILIISITTFATLSVVSGLNKGIKILSEANMVVSGLLLLGILLIGPTVYILSTYLSGMGLYLRDFFNIAMYTAVEPSEKAWQAGWTVFYWAWWISWTPFVGTFIARISKGRTVREVALGAIVLPTIIITSAMTILGAAGVKLNDIYEGAIEKAINQNMSTAIFEMFNYLTDSVLLRSLLSLVAIIAIVIFFVTSSDSGSFVVSSLTSSGRDEPPKVQRIFWAAMEGAIALSVLLIGGEQALTTIQSAVIIMGLPFAVILIMIMIALNKELRESYKKYTYNRTVTLKLMLEKIGKKPKIK
ncbi:MAG: BCCT family transporter, partial [Eubacteriales bacterium]|nr:BCCT family transporter [Eubacteriales bacterium]